MAPSGDLLFMHVAMSEEVNGHAAVSTSRMWASSSVIDNVPSSAFGISNSAS